TASPARSGDNDLISASFLVTSLNRLLQFNQLTKVEFVLSMSLSGARWCTSRRPAPPGRHPARPGPRVAPRRPRRWEEGEHSARWYDNGRQRTEAHKQSPSCDKRQ